MTSANTLERWRPHPLVFIYCALSIVFLGVVWRAWSPCFRLIELPSGLPLTPLFNFGCDLVWSEGKCANALNQQPGLSAVCLYA
jgi:hypothetical protein